MKIDDMTARYVAAVREDLEPTSRAVAMARAVRQHLQDLSEDDPSEGVTPQEIERAHRRAGDLVKMLERMVMIGCITVISSAAPLSPEEAVRVLRGSNSIADRTGAYVVTVEETLRPQAVVIRARPGDGPFGPFPKFRPAPKPPSVTFRVSRRSR